MHGKAYGQVHGLISDSSARRICFCIYTHTSWQLSFFVHSCQDVCVYIQHKTRRAELSLISPSFFVLLCCVYICVMQKTRRAELSLISPSVFIFVLCVYLCSANDAAGRAVADQSRLILYTAAIWGGNFAYREQNNNFAYREQNSPPKYLGNKSEIAHVNFTPPPHNFGLQHQVRKPPLPNPWFPYEIRKESRCHTFD